MTVEVELHALGSKGTIRPVELPDNLLRGGLTQTLSRVFHYGQNDHQPKSSRSISVGDVIRLNGHRFIIRAVGFEVVSEDYRPAETDWLLG